MWFKNNGIGDEGAKQLAESLANNATLTSLDLRGARWCIVTPAFVCICIHMYGRVFYIDAIVKLTLTLNLALNLTLMLTLTLTITLILTVMYGKP